MDGLIIVSACMNNSQIQSEHPYQLFQTELLVWYLTRNKGPIDASSGDSKGFRKFPL